MNLVTVICFCRLFFFTQKTAYEVRISDWSSDVCSSDLRDAGEGTGPPQGDPDRPRKGRMPALREDQSAAGALPRHAARHVRSALPGQPRVPEIWPASAAELAA